MRNYIKYGRIHNNVVTVIVTTPDRNWLELNSKSNTVIRNGQAITIPGEWEIIPEHVKAKWTKDPATGTWSAPTN
jgi:hypothetical protein